MRSTSKEETVTLVHTEKREEINSNSACRLAVPHFCVLLHAFRAECEDRLRAEFRIEMNAAVAESEQRWQNKEQELQTQISELQSELSKSQVSLLH